MPHKAFILKLSEPLQATPKWLVEVGGVDSLPKKQNAESI
jgi:hypothetical protein